MSSLPSRPVGSSNLPARPPVDDRERDRSPPRRGGEQQRRGGGAGGAPGGRERAPDEDLSDWRGPPGSRPPPRRPAPGGGAGGQFDRDMVMDRRRGGPGVRDRSPDRFDSTYDWPFDGGFGRRGGGGGLPPRERPPFRGGRSRSRSWSPPPGGRDRSRSRSPPTMRGPGPPRGAGRDWDGPRYGSGPDRFRDRSPQSMRRRSPSPVRRRRSPSRSPPPPPTHRQFGGARGGAAPVPISPDLDNRRASGGRPVPPAARGRSLSRSPPPQNPYARRGSRDISSRPRSRSRSPPSKRSRQGSTPPHLAHSSRPPPKLQDEAPPARSSGGGPSIHPSRMAIIQPVVSASPSRPSAAPDSEREEGEVDVEMESGEQIAQSTVPKWGKGAVPAPAPNLPTGPRNRFGAPSAPASARGGRVGGYGGGSAYDSAPAPFNPSPSPVRSSLPLPSAGPPPTGPRKWGSRPTPSSSSLPLPPMGSSASVSPRPPVGVLPPSPEEIAAQQARREQAEKVEREREEQLAKEREMAMLKVQVQKWLPKAVVKPPAGPVAETEAEIVSLRLNRLTSLLPSLFTRTLSTCKLSSELGLVLSERDLARDRVRCAEGGSAAAMSRSTSGGAMAALL